jgi:hypothetical protein
MSKKFLAALNLYKLDPELRHLQPGLPTFKPTLQGSPKRRSRQLNHHSRYGVLPPPSSRRPIGNTSTQVCTLRSSWVVVCTEVLCHTSAKLRARKLSQWNAMARPPIGLCLQILAGTRDVCESVLP